jgi:hypothetical protein
MRDEVRDFLDSLGRCRKAISLCQTRIRELENAATRITTAWKEAPGGGGDVHRDGTLAALADQRQKLLEQEVRYAEQMMAVTEFISRVDHSTYQAILTLRYVQQLPWPALTEALKKDFGIYYSERQVTRLHGRALAEARRIWAEEHKEELV